MPIKLVRKPRPGHVMHRIITDEVRTALKTLGDVSVARLKQDVDDWDAKPEFQYTVTLGKQWVFKVKYDSKSDVGKIYHWVDEGTAQRAGRKPYDIYPKQAKALKFLNPRIPIKSQPSKYVPAGAMSGKGGIVGAIKPPSTGGQEEVTTRHVHALGIEPRNFTKALQDELKDRSRPGSFKSVVDAAIRRGSRKIGKKAKG